MVITEETLGSTPSGTHTKHTRYMWDMVVHAVTSALGRLRQQSPKPQAGLGYTARPFLQRTTRKASDMGQWVKKGIHHQA